MKSNLQFVFLLRITLFASYLRDLCLTQVHKDFFSKSFIVLDFTFRSVIYFYWFWYKVKGRNRGSVFAYGRPIVWPPTIENTLLSPLHGVCTFIKKQLASLIYFWTLSSVPWILCLSSYHIPYPVLISVVLW